MQAHLKLININQVRLGFKRIQIEPICLGAELRILQSNNRANFFRFMLHQVEDGGVIQ